VPKAVALMSPVSPTIANEIAHRGYATGFVAALLTAAVVAGLSAVVVAIQMRPARGRSSPTVSDRALHREESFVSRRHMDVLIEKWNEQHPKLWRYWSLEPKEKPKAEPVQLVNKVHSAAEIVARIREDIAAWDNMILRLITRHQSGPDIAELEALIEGFEDDLNLMLDGEDDA
jgi:hypothetical protein